MSADDGQEGAEKAPIQQSLLKFLERFGQVRLTPFKTDPVLWDLGRRVQADLAALPCVKARPDIVVEWSVGKGVWATVPWIAFLNRKVGLTPLKWSIPYVGPMTILDGWNDGKEAPQARRDRRQAAAG